LGTLLLIAVGIGVVAFLAFAGFAIDFGNAWDSKSSGASDTASMYMVVLPLGFVVIVGWVLYTLSKRRSITKTKNLETKIRQQIYQEQGLGTNTQDVLLNTLAKHDSMTVEELSQALNLEREKILMIIKELLQKGAIGQNLTQKPTRFYVL